MCLGRIYVHSHTTLLVKHVPTASWQSLSRSIPFAVRPFPFVAHKNYSLDTNRRIPFFETKPSATITMGAFSFQRNETDLTAEIFILCTGKKVATTPKANKASVTPKNGATKSITVKPAHMKILEATKKLLRAGFDTLEKDTVQTFSDNTKTPEGFKKNLGLMKKAGLISYSGSRMELTNLGMEAIGYDDNTAPATNEVFHAIIADILPNKQAKQIFEVGLDGNEHDKQKVAINDLGLDPKKLSGFNKNLSKLSTMGYLTKTKTTFKLTDKCFPCGRP